MKILCLLFLFVALTNADGNFTIDYKNNCFLKDGNPFRYVSGSIHYFRSPNQLWKDRLYKMKMAGLNTIQTYVEWSGHEPEPGIYNFEDNYDLAAFLQTAKSLDLLVILRAGPFIDAERDMGGLPYWLIRVDPKMKIRTYDQTFIKYLERWYSVLLPIIRPFLYKNGGPIIMAQIENEYGSLAVCDAQYTTFLKNLFKRFLKDEVLLFTTDGCLSSVLTCGKVDQVFSTVDFGPGANVTDIFDMVRWHQSCGPLVNSEFYSGWLDHWGEPHAETSTESVTKTLFEILSANASVNIYMFHGGTSFGFTAGANMMGDVYQACPTSYDYDAPLTEAGDPTPKYYAIRETIGKFMPLPPGTLPQPSQKLISFQVQMKPGISLFELAANGKVVTSDQPLSFEDLKQPYGFVLYGTTVRNLTSDPVLLTVKNLADRGYVFVNKKWQGILSREQKIFSMPLSVQVNDVIEILVENQGRVCFGNSVNEKKGIFNNVTLGSEVLKGWTMTTLSMDTDFIDSISNLVARVEPSFVPRFYTGSFKLSKVILDTFLRVDGFSKGVAFINGFNIGRYWPIVGPQVTLYVPSTLLQEGDNTVTLFELENSPCDQACYVKFVPTPVVNGTTPLKYRKGQFSYGKKYLRKN